MPSEIEKAHEYLDDNQDNIISFLKELIKKESVTGNEYPAQEVIINKFESLGLDPDVWEPDVENLRSHPAFFETESFKEKGYDGRPNVAAVSPGGGNGRSLAFNGHIDVVSPEPEEDWTHGPWNPVIEDGKMYGRGTGDMKGGIASFIFAYQSLMENDIELQGDLILQTTIEEEEGGVGGLLSALERGYQPDAAIMPEPYHVPNIAIASAGILNFRITVPGKTAHAARGYLGESAVEKSMHIYSSLLELDKQRKENISYEPAIRLDPRAEGHVTNINIGVFEAGDWPSTVPGKAVLEGRVGWPPGETQDEIKNQIEEAIQKAVESDEWLSEYPPEIEWFGIQAEPHELDTEEEIVKLSKKHSEYITGGETDFIGGTAGLDERYYNLYYDIPCPSVGPKGYHPHSVDEYVDIQSVIDTAKIHAAIAIDWCGTQ